MPSGGTSTSGLSIERINFAENLFVRNGSTVATQVRITTDRVVLRNPDNNTFVVFDNVDETATITTGGANGLDTGSEASNTWYFVWLISNGNVVDSLLSTSATAPTMPSGYAYRMRVGSVRNNASSNFFNFVQYGKECRYLENTNTSPFLVLSSGGQTSFTDVDCTAVVPSAVSRLAIAHPSLQAPSTGAGIQVRPNGDTTASLFILYISTGETVAAPNIIPLGSDGIFEYKLDVSSGTPAAMAIHGYIDSGVNA